MGCFSEVKPNNTAMGLKMAKRIVFGALMIAAFGAALYGGWRLDRSGPPAALRMLPTTAVLLLLIVLGYRELARLAASTGARLLNVSGLVFAAALAAMPYWQPLANGHLSQAGIQGGSGLLAMVILAGLAAAFIEQMAGRRAEMALQRIGMTLLAMIYLGLGGYFLLVIRTWGVEMLVVFLVAVKCTDIGAYFTGSAIGRHKFIPWLSPGKTWEGFAGGLATGAVFSLLAIKLLAAELPITFSTVIWIVAVGAAGQFADLCESLLKRSANLKDSGAVVPEFGGVLDIIDSPLLAAPVAVLLAGLLQRTA